MDFIKSQDIVVLLKILLQGKDNWKYESLHEDLHLSISAIHRSLERCVTARFISPKPYKDVYIKNLAEFLLHGAPYAFAIEPGKMIRGLPTAHSAPPLNKEIVSEKESYVWASPHGKVRGQSIEPLMKYVPEIAVKDKVLYELLALIDAIRLGRPREKNIASEMLKEKLEYYAGSY